MHFDRILEHVGDFGTYQQIQCTILFLVSTCSALHMMSSVMQEYIPSHRCYIPALDANGTGDALTIAAFIPWDADEQGFSSCLWYGEEGLAGNGSQAVECDRWTFDTSVRSSSVSEWSTVCSRTYMRALIRSVFMAGVMAGCIVMGMISDKFGRKKVIIVSCMANIAMSALVALSASYTMYITLRFLLGATCAGIYVVAYTLSMEFIGPSKRNVVGMSMSLPFTLAIALLSITGYFLTQWRAFQVAISLPLVPCLIATRFLDESARWLLVHKRKEEVIDIIETAAKMNKVVIPDAIYAETNNIEVSELTSQATLKDLLASRVILRLTLNLCCSMFANGAIYYGIGLNTAALGGDLYISFLISGIVEIPGYLVTMYLMQTFGRKPAIIGLMSTSGVSCLVASFLAGVSVPAAVALSMLGKLAVSGSFGAEYVFVSESYPSALRNTGLGVTLTMARTGAVVAPFIVLTGSAQHHLPYIIFCALAVASALLLLILPETKDRDMPDTLEDCDRFLEGNKKKAKKPNKRKKKVKTEVDPVTDARVLAYYRVTQI